MTNVVFFKETSQLKEALHQFDLSGFSDKSVLVKLHMGELNNRFFIRPDFVKQVISYLYSVQAKPFLYDTTVLYNSARNTTSGYKKVAAKHGFSQENIGCPITIDNKGISVDCKGNFYEVGDQFFQSDHIFCLSHVKGHVATGMGGAIKNIGMGGVTPQTKKMMHHGSKPVFNEQLCTYCGACATVCPFNAITVYDDSWNISKSCFGCGVCVENCPSQTLTYQLENLQYLLACSTKACVQEKQVLYINDINRISDSCDCDPGAKKLLCPDVGFCVSTDPVAVDHASLILIDEIEKDVFQKNIHVNPYQQIHFGEQIGLGSTDYKLIRL